MTDHAPQLTFHVSRFTFGFRISAPPPRRCRPNRLWHAGDRASIPSSPNYRLTSRPPSLKIVPFKHNDGANLT